MSQDARGPVSRGTYLSVSQVARGTVSRGTYLSVSQVARGPVSRGTAWNTLTTPAVSALVRGLILEGDSENVAHA